MNRTDKIRLVGMTFQAKHGLMPHEKEVAQRFDVDVELTGDFERAAETDDISQTYNYARIYRIVEQTVRERSFNLIEALAVSIANAILAVYSDLVVRVVVRKPNAPLPGPIETVEVEVTRGPSGSEV
jgi:dihydroneopterin aldolase